MTCVRSRVVLVVGVCLHVFVARFVPRAMAGQIHDGMAIPEITSTFNIVFD